MDTTTTRPVTDTNNVAAAKLQSDRFQARQQIQANSVVRNDAVYFSPVVKIDTSTSAVIIQYRDSETGEVKNQFPNPEQVKRYDTSAEIKRAAEVKAQYAPPVVQTAPAPVKAPVAAKAPVVEDAGFSADV